MVFAPIKNLGTQIVVLVQNPSIHQLLVMVMKIFQPCCKAAADYWFGNIMAALTNPTGYLLHGRSIYKNMQPVPVPSQSGCSQVWN